MIANIAARHTGQQELLHVTNFSPSLFLICPLSICKCIVCSHGDGGQCKQLPAAPFWVDFPYNHGVQNSESQTSILSHASTFLNCRVTASFFKNALKAIFDIKSHLVL